MEPDRILALVDRKLPESESAKLISHVALCSHCRRAYDETLELAQLSQAFAVSEQARAKEPARPRRSFWQRWLAPGAGFALGAAAGVLLLIVFAQSDRAARKNLDAALKQQRDRAVIAQSAKKALESRLAEAQKTGQGETRRISAELAKLQAAARDQAQKVARLQRDAVILQQIPLPAPEWLTAPEGGRLRGGSTAHSPPEIRAVHPVESAITDSTPAFIIRPAPGATQYEITLEMADSNEEVPQPRRIDETRWQMAAPLKAGTIYQWSVTAQRGTDLFRSPVVKFYVLSTREQEEIARARRQLSGNPLALAAVYARLGLHREAESQLAAVRKSDPQNPTAKRWLTQIRSRLSTPPAN